MVDDRSTRELADPGPRVGVFDDVWVTREGTSTTVGGEGRRTLLALLVAHRGEVVPTGRVVATLWPDRPPPSAAKVVQTYVSQLRRLLEPDRRAGWEVLRTRSAGYLLDLPPAAVDVAAFEAAVATARSASGRAWVEALRRALAGWHGEPYAGVDRPFARTEAQRLGQVHRRALLDCAAAAVAEPGVGDPVPDLERLRAQDPADERAAALLMEALWGGGRRTDALRVHAGLRRHRAEELGVSPQAGTDALHRRILRDDAAHREPTARDGDRATVRDAEPAPRPVRRGLLPVERTSLVGRDEDVERLVDTVRRERLTTVLGAGGAGKTRVALRVAHVLGDDAGRLGARPGQLRARPRRRRRPRRVPARGRARGARPRDEPRADRPGRGAAVARAGPQPAGRPHRLDGMPLAIELAAVRVGGMTVADLDAGLAARFALLTGGERTALPRQRTLLATTEWSHALLRPEQRVLLERLRVIVGPFDVAAAVEVCSGAPLDPRAVPGLLADLVDHSVVEHDGSSGYRLLETVREFGLSRLGAELPRWRARRDAWAVGLVEEVGRRLLHRTTYWYRRLEEHLLDVQAALESAVARGDAALALRLATGGGWAMINMGRFPQQRDWIHRSLALDGEVAVDHLARGMLMAGAVAGLERRFAEAYEHLDRSEACSREVHDREGTLWVAYWRAATLAEEGRLEEAAALGATAAREAADRDLPDVEANLLAGLAEVIMGLVVEDPTAPARPEHARRALDRAATLCGQEELEETGARVTMSRALLASFGEDVDEALRRCLEELDEWRVIGRGNRLALALVATARVAVRAGRPGTAGTLLREALDVVDALGWSLPLPLAVEAVVAVGVDTAPAEAAALLEWARGRPPTHRWRVPLDLAPARAALRDVPVAEPVTAFRAVLDLVRRALSPDSGVSR